MFSKDEPPLQEFATFIFDPLQPVPTTGSANSHFFPGNIRPKDRTRVEKRQDVLVYTSIPLEASLTLIGPIKAVLYVATEGKSSDFAAKLVLVRPDGYARNIEDGIVRMIYEATNDSLTLSCIGRVHRLEIGLGATAMRMNKGARLRLEVLSSDSPKYDGNPNTGENPFFATEFKRVR